MGGKGKTLNKKRKFVGNREDDTEFDLTKKHLKTSHIRSMEKRLIIVLEGAQLETVKVRQTNSLNAKSYILFEYRWEINLSY